MSDSKIKVAELFAGVGGFHLGLKRASEDFEVVWADQFEPSKRNQFAYNIYKKNFPKTFISNEDISKVDKTSIPDINLLVGGFPCQDYSVASTRAKGLYGKKGVLWWDIRDVIKKKWPPFILLENVDRLLTSPGVNSEHPGRDFGMILRTLSDLDYGVVWKVINAADYGFPQRRRRTFIFAFHDETKFNKDIEKIVESGEDKIKDFIQEMPPLSSTLKNDSIGTVTTVNLQNYYSLTEFSNKFTVNKGFRKTGLMINGFAYMADYVPAQRVEKTLRSIIEPASPDSKLFLSLEQKEKFRILKNGFHTIKVTKTGHEYKYGMGGIAFPDSLDKPARTMVTTEHTVSRMSHVVQDPGNDKLRLISPQESELINTFPRDWTKLDGVIDSNRYFAMGNALVVDLVKELGKEIKKIFNKDELISNITPENKGEEITH